MNARIWIFLFLLIPVLLLVVPGAYLLYEWHYWQGHAESSTDGVLELTCEQPVIKAGIPPARFSAPRLTVVIVNRGDTKVLLVDPGDGSTEGWRTPTIAWSQGVAIPGGRCGKTNALMATEVFMLQPGESRRLSSWVGRPYFDKPGRNQVSVRYVNDPDQEWQGLSLRNHNTWAMSQVRRSTKVSAVSNTVEIVVEE